MNKKNNKKNNYREPPSIKRSNFNAYKQTERDFTLAHSDSPLSITINKNESIISSVANTKKVISLIATVKEQNDEILRWINRQNTKNVNNVTGLPDIPFSFPLNTVEELDQLDVYLKANNDDSIALSAYLSSLGRNNVPNKTNRILKYILADTVAINFNYCGKRSQKRASSDLSLKNLIVDAVKTSIINTTDKEIEDAIKIWLKHAQDRIKKSRENARKN